MYQQINIFDFIGDQIKQKKEKLLSRTLFERIFEIVRDPVCLCTNCLCEYCVNNAEQSHDKSRSGEMREPCFNCDECRIYGGDHKLKIQMKWECDNFVISHYGAERNRKRIRLIKRQEF